MKKIASLPWAEFHSSLDERGYCVVPGMLAADECGKLSELYNKENLFRSTINMERYRFGRGEYRYFNYSLPSLIQEARQSMYPFLATIANDWMKRLSISTVFPADHKDLIGLCNSNGQARPTPLILRYEAGGFNTLHQDLYGEIYFPFQVVFLLSEPGKDFSGGEFLLIEQLPRAQSKAQVIPLRQGDAMIFTTNFRPVKGTRGYYRARIKHGVSEVTSGERFALGIIFHDAK